MKNLYFLKTIPGENINKSVLKKEIDLKKAINQNTINLYVKIPFVKKDDILTCCKPEKSFAPDPGPAFHLMNPGAGFENGLTFKVDYVNFVSNYIVMFGARNKCGVLPHGVRFATEEEIKKFNKTQK